MSKEAGKAINLTHDSILHYMANIDLFYSNLLHKVGQDFLDIQYTSHMRSDSISMFLTEVFALMILMRITVI